MYVTLQGMIKYWEMRGKEEDVWISCDSPEERLTVYFKIEDIYFFHLHCLGGLKAIVQCSQV